MRPSLPLALLFASRIAAGEPALVGTRVASHDDLGQRRAIRGETLDGHESAALAELRRFEEERLLPSLAGYVPAPLGKPPAAYANLKLPDIAVRWDERVVRYLDWFAHDRRGHAILGSWLRAEGRYRERIESALAQNHLPHALLYIAMIESGFDPLDRSWAGASGLWQFMPEGARIYGLRVDHWVDERNDPDKATLAQMRYFADLHARFGSWHLALAAFNAGYGAALGAMAKYNTNDYWDLCRHEDGLPWETVNYVPKFIAAAIAGENREAFGFGSLVEDPPERFDEVPVGASITLEEAARLAGVTVAEVTAANPELKRGRTPPVGSWVLKLPSGTGPRFLARAAHAEREPLATHVVKQGERLAAIARRHQSSEARLRKLNGIRDASEVRPGLVLLVPALGKAAEARAGDAAEPPLVVAVADKDRALAGRARLFYRVVPGDGLDDIARAFGVSFDELCAWNRLDPTARLASGMVLELFVPEERAAQAMAMGAIPVEGIDAVGEARGAPRLQLVNAGSEDHLDLVEKQRGRRRVVYLAHAGETLKRVGIRFGLTEGDLERINRIGRGTLLAAGQPVVVYVPLTALERAGGGAKPIPVENEPYGPPAPPAEQVAYGPPEPPRQADRPASERAEKDAAAVDRPVGQEPPAAEPAHESEAAPPEDPPPENPPPEAPPRPLPRLPELPQAGSP